MIMEKREEQVINIRNEIRDISLEILQILKG